MMANAAARVIAHRQDNVVWVELGGRLKELRNKKGLTMQELAHKAKTGRSMIAKLEAGDRRINGSWIARLSKALEVTPDEITKGINLAGVPMQGHARMPRHLPAIVRVPRASADDLLTVTRGNEVFVVDFRQKTLKVGTLTELHQLSA